MIRAPVISIAFWLALGFSAGWWVNSLYSSKVQLPSQIVQLPPPSSPPAESGPQPGYKQSLRDYRLAQQAQSPNAESISAQREKILDHAEALIDENDPEARSLLDEFLDLETFDPRAMFLKARAAFLRGSYAEALNTALELKTLPQAEVRAEDIDELLDSIIPTYATELEQLERLDDLLDLYTRLTVAIPEDRQFYYRLAEIQYRLNRYYDTITSLNYSLYDPVWGERSRILLEKAQQYINLEDGEQVSLESEGGHFLVNAQINYFANVRLLVDTGASLSSLRPEIARGLGVPFDDEEQAVVHVAGGSFRAPLATLDALAIGDVEATNIGINIVELGPEIGADGLLGMNFLRRYRFFIDQDRELLFLGAK